MYNYREQSAAMLAASGSIISLILVILFIPYFPRKTICLAHSPIDKTVDISETKRSDEESVSVLSIFHIRKILTLLFVPQVCFS